MTDAQAAARAAALAAQSNIPNGLGQGGLQVAEGVTLDEVAAKTEADYTVAANLG
ncbi:hypothetical protein D3C79_1068930 [compost metagenome]